MPAWHFGRLVPDGGPTHAEGVESTTDSTSVLMGTNIPQGNHVHIVPNRSRSHVTPVLRGYRMHERTAYRGQGPRDISGVQAMHCSHAQA